jgi:hypothetical protein
VLPVEPKPPRWLEVGDVCDGELRAVSLVALPPRLVLLLPVPLPPLLDVAACWLQLGVPGGQAAGAR